MTVTGTVLVRTIVTSNDRDIDDFFSDPGKILFCIFFKSFGCALARLPRMVTIRIVFQMIPGTKNTFVSNYRYQPTYVFF